jgi:autoinducer 2-degrading protein
MLVLLVTVRVKPEHLAEFLPAARHNAEHAVADEPGCLRFDIIQDREDQHLFRFYEVYKDDAALAAHRQTPHFKKYIEASAPWMAVPAERTIGDTVLYTS